LWPRHSFFGLRQAVRATCKLQKNRVGWPEVEAGVRIHVGFIGLFSFGTIASPTAPKTDVCGNGRSEDYRVKRAALTMGENRFAAHSSAGLH
jgi:hypothetical protein